MHIGRDPYDNVFKNTSDFVANVDADTVPIHDVPIPPSFASSSSHHDNSEDVLNAINTLSLNMNNRFDTLQASMTSSFHNRIDALQVDFDHRLYDMQRSTNDRFEEQQGSLDTMNDVLADILKSME